MVSIQGGYLQGHLDLRITSSIMLSNDEHHVSWKWLYSGLIDLLCSLVCSWMVILPDVCIIPGSDKTSVCFFRFMRRYLIVWIITLPFIKSTMTFCDIVTMLIISQNYMYCENWGIPR